VHLFVAGNTRSLKGGESFAPFVAFQSAGSGSLWREAIYFVAWERGRKASFCSVDHGFCCVTAQMALLLSWNLQNPFMSFSCELGGLIFVLVKEVKAVLMFLLRPVLLLFSYIKRCILQFSYFYRKLKSGLIYFH